MKKIIWMFGFTLSVLCMNAADIAEIISSFKEGRASEIAENMDAEVDIAVPGSTKKGSGADAIVLLTHFFESKKPTGFTVLHHADKNENGFVVGRLATGDGEFRVNITYHTKDNKLFIQSIRIE